MTTRKRKQNTPPEAPPEAPPLTEPPQKAIIAGRVQECVRISLCELGGLAGHRDVIADPARMGALAEANALLTRAMVLVYNVAGSPAPPEADPVLPEEKK